MGLTKIIIWYNKLIGIYPVLRPLENAGLGGINVISTHQYQDILLHQKEKLTFCIFFLFCRQLFFIFFLFSFMLAALSWRSYQFCAKKLVKLSVNILSFCVKDHTYLPFSFAMLKFILIWSQCKISYAKFALCLVMLIIHTRGHFSVNSIMRREIQNVICETSYVIDELWAWIKRILFKLWRCSSQSWKFLAEIKQSILFLRPPSPSILEENDDDFWW